LESVTKLDKTKQCKTGINISYCKPMSAVLFTNSSCIQVLSAVKILLRVSFDVCGHPHPRRTLLCTVQLERTDAGLQPVNRTSLSTSANTTYHIEKY